MKRKVTIVAWMDEPIQSDWPRFLADLENAAIESWSIGDRKYKKLPKRVADVIGCDE